MKTLKASKSGTTIQNCNFHAVKFDKTAVAALQTIAQGLVENAKALGALAAVLNASNITIDAMVKVGPT